MKRPNPFLMPAPKKDAKDMTEAPPPAAGSQPAPAAPAAAAAGAAAAAPPPAAGPAAPPPEQVWDKWKRRLPPEVVASLRRGAAPEDVRQLERKLRCQLPLYARRIWCTHNGQTAKDPKLGVFGSTCRMLPADEWRPLLDVISDDAGVLEDPQKECEFWEWWSDRAESVGLPYNWTAGHIGQNSGNCAFPGAKLVSIEHPRKCWMELPGGFVALRAGVPEDIILQIQCPGLTGGDSHVSFRVANRPGHYLYAAGNSLTIERYGLQFSQRSAFQKQASFAWHKDGTGGFELVSNRGTWLCVRPEDGQLTLSKNRPPGATRIMAQIPDGWVFAKGTPTQDSGEPGDPFYYYWAPGDGGRIWYVDMRNKCKMAAASFEQFFGAYAKENHPERHACAAVPFPFFRKRKLINCEADDAAAGGGPSGAEYDYY
eukprot:TRINITY_DN26022_c0_g1_i1.p1 TRINITY_DN26022_c0_g1~~TRINITY_DN26022_c0_g1_i1.p1  ORF type:complete len:427 (+),score=117.89 TRINITY_DN26022_c0_g1_i1:86-1366(+)